MTASNTTQAGRGWDAGLYDDRHAFVWRHGAALIELLAPQPGERILDLGCGTGHLTARIAAAGATAVGLDASAEMLAKARAAYPQLELVHGDACSFVFAEPFDAVFSNATLHWIKKPEAVLRCVRDALKPGGRFVAELGGKGNVRVVLDALRVAAAQTGVLLEEPLWFFPGVAEYATLLEASKMEVVFATLFDRPTPLEGENGLRDWVRMFASSVLDRVPPDRLDDFLRTVEQTAQTQLLRDGVWTADYRRLRVVAIRQPC